MKKTFDVHDDHVPDNTGKGQWIGVEIECFMPMKELYEFGKKKVKAKPRDEDADANGYDDDEDDYYDEDEATERLAKLLREYDIPNVGLKGDGSISSPGDGYFEVEIAILFKRSDKGPLKRLCKLLNELGTRVNRSCGLHVHLDCRDIVKGDVEREYYGDLPKKAWKRGENLENALPLMLKMVSESRRNNSYCHPSMSASNRTAINLSALYKHKTIEVRLHQGSVDYYKISNWVDFLYRVSRARKGMRVSTVAELKKLLGKNSKRLSEYVDKRMKAVA